MRERLLKTKVMVRREAGMSSSEFVLAITRLRLEHKTAHQYTEEDIKNIMDYGKNLKKGIEVTKKLGRYSVEYSRSLAKKRACVDYDYNGSAYVAMLERRKKEAMDGESYCPGGSSSMLGTHSTGVLKV